MNKIRSIQEFWNGVQITVHNFDIKKNVGPIKNDNNLFLNELHESAKKNVDEMHLVSSNFQSALKNF